jgi:hypothetical protein
MNYQLWVMAVMAEAIVRDIRDGRSISGAVTYEAGELFERRFREMYDYADERGISIGELAKEYVDFAYGKAEKPEWHF